MVHRGVEPGSELQCKVFGPSDGRPEACNDKKKVDGDSATNCLGNMHMWCTIVPGIKNK